MRGGLEVAVLRAVLALALVPAVPAVVEHIGASDGRITLVPDVVAVTAEPGTIAEAPFTVTNGTDRAVRIEVRTGPPLSPPVRPAPEEWVVLPPEVTIAAGARAELTALVLLPAEAQGSYVASLAVCTTGCTDLELLLWVGAAPPLPDVEFDGSELRLRTDAGAVADVRVRVRAWPDLVLSDTIYRGLGTYPGVPTVLRLEVPWWTPPLVRVDVVLTDGVRTAQRTAVVVWGRSAWISTALTLLLASIAAHVRVRRRRRS